MKQLDIFTLLESSPTVTSDGTPLLSPKDAGIKQAEVHANQVHANWSDQAYSFLVDFVRVHDGEFMTEQFRKYAYGQGLPFPPSERSFGAVIVRAVREQKIIAVGFGKVTNPKAHQANATIWRKL